MKLCGCGTTGKGLNKEAEWHGQVSQNNKFFKVLNSNLILNLLQKDNSLLDYDAV